MGRCSKGSPFHVADVVKIWLHNEVLNLVGLPVEEKGRHFDFLDAPDDSPSVLESERRHGLREI